MSHSLYLIFNHKITCKQEQDARESLGVDKIIELPPALDTIWRQIPPDLGLIKNYLKPVKDWLASHARKNDYLLIQGDFGACYIMANFAFKIGLIPIYSTTRREAVEEHDDDGTVKLTHHFRHRIFRKYGV
ncbi:MAG: hypothetical protein J7K30_13940 [Deltaproteobacteria bacterium]|nr:hypothetical protein [Deltaproteobacteria bacterium]